MKVEQNSYWQNLHRLRTGRQCRGPFPEDSACVIRWPKTCMVCTKLIWSEFPFQLNLAQLDQQMPYLLATSPKEHSVFRRFFEKRTLQAPPRIDTSISLPFLLAYHHGFPPPPWQVEAVRMDVRDASLREAEMQVPPLLGVRGVSGGMADSFLLDTDSGRYWGQRDR